MDLGDGDGDGGLRAGQKDWAAGGAAPDCWRLAQLSKWGRIFFTVRGGAFHSTSRHAHKIAYQVFEPVPKYAHGYPLPTCRLSEQGHALFDPAATLRGGAGLDWVRVFF